MDTAFITSDRCVLASFGHLAASVKLARPQTLPVLHQPALALFAKESSACRACHTCCSLSCTAGLLCYMLLLSGRSPSKILFAKDSGRLFQLDLLPLYNDKGMVERIEVVPYRLTRNLATFFTAFGVEVSKSNIVTCYITCAGRFVLLYDHKGMVACIEVSRKNNRTRTKYFPY
jgi:hypothetical protein